MTNLIIGIAFLCLISFSFFLGRSRAVAVSGGHTRHLHSRVGHYGTFVALWCALPCLVLVTVWSLVEPYVAQQAAISSLPERLQQLPANELSLIINEINNVAYGVVDSANADESVRQAAERYNSTRGISSAAMMVLALVVAIAGLYYGRRLISPELRARNQVERVITIVMILASTIAILTTVGIVLSLLFESLRFFAQVSPLDFLFGLHWSPQTALREDQVGGSGSFGAIPLFAGTLLITFIAMCVAVPIGLYSAIYMSEYASPRLRASAKPVLEILAGVPTVVYGFFAALTVAPTFRGWGEGIGLTVSSESALAAGVVMGIMIIPFVSSLSDDVINAVPQSLRDGSFALGATKAETIRQVILPAALPGVVGAILLAVSRAIGETMIVVMAAGLAANLTANPLQAVTTVTVQIVTLLVGDQEFDSAKTLAAFALGLVLFLVTLALNIVALHVVRKYREKYD